MRTLTAFSTDTAGFGRSGKVIDQLDVGREYRWQVNHQGKGETCCNMFVWDTTRAMGAESRHWVDREGNPAGLGKGNNEPNPNDVVVWMHQHGNEQGWRKDSAGDSQKMANEGHPATLTRNNPGGIGPVAAVRPGEISRSVRTRAPRLLRRARGT